MSPSIFATGLVAILSLPFVVLAFAQGAPYGVIALLLALAAVGAMAISTRGRLDVDADGLTYTSGFKRARLPWSRVTGFVIYEVPGSGVDWYEIQVDEAHGMRFTSLWKNGERAAACIQRRSPTDAPLDRSDRIALPDED